MIEITNVDVGMTITIQKSIKEEDTALNYGSGKLDTLLATPSLVALMIEAAVKLVDDKLPEGFITVGKMTKVVHENPTVQGATVSVKVQVIDFNGARLLFDMVAYDEIGLIGRGTHERIIVNKNSLLNKAQQRAEKLKSMDY